MSLINEMLRDLETRQAAELGKPDLLREIRPLPTGPVPSYRGVVLFCLGVLVTTVTGAGIWIWQTILRSEQSVERRAEFGATTSTPPSISALTTSATVTPPVPVESNHSSSTEILRLAEELSSWQPDLTPSPSAAIKSAPPGREKYTEDGSSRSPESLRTAVARSASPISGAQSVAGNIDKIPVMSTPRERADAEYRRAQSQLAAGGGAGAVADVLQGALKLDSGYNPARQLLLRIFLEARRIDEAMGLLLDGLEQQPAQIGWAMSLARLQVEKGDVAGGERTLARSRSYGGNSGEYLGFYGYLLLQQGKFQEAAEQYLAATKLAPADGRWWFGLGQALEAGGHSDDARSAFRRALAAGNLSADLITLAEQKVR